MIARTLACVLVIVVVVGVVKMTTRPLLACPFVLFVGVAAAGKRVILDGPKAGVGVHGEQRRRTECFGKLKVGSHLLTRSIYCGRELFLLLGAKL